MKKYFISIIVSVILAIVFFGCANKEIAEPELYIHSEVPNPVIREGDMIDLKAKMENHNISSCNLVWSSDIDGNISTVSNTIMNTDELSVGKHLITVATTVNGEELTAEHTVTVKPKRNHSHAVVTKKFQPFKRGTLVVYKEVIKDTKTGLMWSRGDDEHRRTLAAAKMSTENSKLAGYSDWRLPTIDELTGALNARKDSSQTIDFNVWDIKAGSKYWSSTYHSKTGENKYYSGLAIDNIPGNISNKRTSTAIIAENAGYYTLMVRDS